MKFNTPRGPGFLEMRIQVHTQVNLQKTWYTLRQPAFSTACIHCIACVFRHLSLTIEQVLCAAPLGFRAPPDFASSIMGLPSWFLLVDCHPSPVILLRLIPDYLISISLKSSKFCEYSHVSDSKCINFDQLKSKSLKPIVHISNYSLTSVSSSLLFFLELTSLLMNTVKTDIWFSKSDTLMNGDLRLWQEKLLFI